MILSYHNKPEIKEQLIARMDKHIELDQLLKGATGQDGKGCTVWCALNNGDLKEGYNHKAFETILGLPEWLARLQDVIFEGLNVDDAKWFSSQWPKSIPVGKNLDPVKWKFCAFVMKENIERVLLLDISDELKKQVVDAINGVLSLHNNAIETGVWDGSAARSAWSAARSAESAAWSAESAAWSAARSAWSAARSAESAAWSAESAAWSAESAARSAARSAWSAARSAWSAARSAESAAWSAESAARSAESAARSAESAAFKHYADELLRLLEAA
jgi:hypothetical protein